VSECRVCRVLECATDVQPVSEKTRLDMVVDIQIEIEDGHHRSLFTRLIRKETSALSIENFDFNSDDHFESHCFGNGGVTTGPLQRLLYRVSEAYNVMPIEDVGCNNIDHVGC